MGVIRLHHLSARAEGFFLNPDLIVAIDTTPDTVVTLTTHQKVLVKDAPEDIVAAIHAWRTSILTASMPSSSRRRSEASLSLVRGAATDATAHRNHEEPTR